MASPGGAEGGTAEHCVTLHLHTVYKVVMERTREEIMGSMHRIRVLEIEGAFGGIGSGLIL